MNPNHIGTNFDVFLKEEGIMTDKNFEKGINVPSKEKIMYDYNAKDCEQCSSDSVCCYCKNIACYKLEEQLKAKEQECEKLTSKCSQLKQTLTEIKEIAEILTPMTDEYENCLDRDRCFECDFTEDCTYFNIKQILQKISEVEDEQ